MTRLSKALISLALILAATTAVRSYAHTDSDLFATVAADDPTRASFAKLEKWGLLPQGSSAGPLTRYDAAALIVRAEQSAKEKGLLVVAQAELDLSGGEAVVEQKPVKPGEGSAADESGGLSAAEGPTVIPLDEARKTFKTLQDAYDYELSAMKADHKRVMDKVERIENQDFLLWKQVRGLSSNSTISLHGFGRSMWSGAQYFGSVSPHPFDRYPFNVGKASAFIDFVPTGTVSKELKWVGILRMSTDLTSGSAGNSWNVPRISMLFNPPFMSAVAGDFDLSWTPLTVWNRSSLDRQYTPDVLARLDDYAKYPIFMNNAPDFPFRGVRAGTELVWEKSQILSSFKMDTFVHQLRSGFAKGYVANRYTGWIFGGMGEVKAKKYLSVAGYGLLYTEPLDTDLPGSAYNPLDTLTWAQKYQVGSVRPKLEIASKDLALGAAFEIAGSKYQDDERSDARVISDGALVGGPFLKWKESSIQVNTMDVGYAFYSPLAQLREVNDYDGSLTSHPVKLSADPVNDALGRAGDLFKFYNRLTDNVIPYGDATPNRKGVNFKADIQGGPQNAFHVKGSFYSLKAIQEDLALNAARTATVPVENMAMNRKFTYVNIGPRVDFGALMNSKRKVEFGFNVRSEKTKHTFGDLTGNQYDLGLTVGMNRNWDLSLAAGTFSGKGAEMGYMGSTLARYPYIYDPKDAGAYLPFVVDQKNTYEALSSVIRLGIHSQLAADAILKSGEESLIISPATVSTTSGKFKNQTLDVVYEVIF